MTQKYQSSISGLYCISVQQNVRQFYAYDGRESANRLSAYIEKEKKQATTDKCMLVYHCPQGRIAYQRMRACLEAAEFKRRDVGFNPNSNNVLYMYYFIPDTFEFPGPLLYEMIEQWGGERVKGYSEWSCCLYDTNHVDTPTLQFFANKPKEQHIGDVFGDPLPIRITKLADNCWVRHVYYETPEEEDNDF